MSNDELDALTAFNAARNRRTATRKAVELARAEDTKALLEMALAHKRLTSINIKAAEKYGPSWFHELDGDREEIIRAAERMHGIGE